MATQYLTSRNGIVPPADLPKGETLTWIADQIHDQRAVVNDVASRSGGDSGHYLDESTKYGAMLDYASTILSTK